jgi:hypothetical protein
MIGIDTFGSGANPSRNPMINNGGSRGTDRSANFSKQNSSVNDNPKIKPDMSTLVMFRNGFLALTVKKAFIQ